MLTDEKIKELRKQVSDQSGEWHFDLVAFARLIEEEVLNSEQPNPAVAAIQYVLDNPTEDPVNFLHAWNEGDFECIRRDWENVPDDVFIGADPLFKPTPGGTQ